MMGHKENLPSFTLNAVEEAITKTANNTGLVLNFALNYGGRREMLEAIKEIATDVQDGRLSTEQIDEQLLSSRLLSGDIRIGLIDSYER